MFASMARKEATIRVLLIAVILLNAFASNTKPVQANQDIGPTTGSRLNEIEQEPYSIPTFERPAPRMGDGNSGGFAEASQTNVTTKANTSSPIMFIENVGQFDPRSHFQAHGANSTIFFTDSVIWFTMIELSDDKRNLRSDHDSDDHPVLVPVIKKGVNLKISFPDASPKTRIEPFDRLDTKISNFRGNNSSDWHTNIPAWGGVRYVDLFPGADLEISSENGNMVWSIVIRDETRFYQSKIIEKQGLRVKIQGGNKITQTNNTTNLLTEIGNLEFPGIQIRGLSRSMENYTIINNDELLLIPPRSTSVTDINYNINTNASFNDYFHFATFSTQNDNTKLLSPLQDTPPQTNILLAKIFGGTFTDHPADIKLGNDGFIYIAGDTNSPDFPTTPGAFDPSFNNASGWFDTYLVKMDTMGNILYSTFLGGLRSDFVESMALAQDNSIYLAGVTYSPDFPITSDAYDSVYNGSGGVSSEGFITQINLAEENNPVYSSYFDYPLYLGGNIHNAIYDIFLDTDQRLILNLKGSDGGTGHTHYFLRFDKETEEIDFAFPIPGDINEMEYVDGWMYFTGQDDSDLNCDSFVGKATDLGIDYMTTILEGDCIGTEADGEVIEVGPSGNVYVLHTLWVFETESFKNAYISKFDSMGAEVNNVFLGTVDETAYIEMKVDLNGGIYIVGSLDTGDTLNLINLGSAEGREDVFAVRLQQVSSYPYYRATSGVLIYGDDDDSINSLDIDQNGNMYVGGTTQSDVFAGIPRNNSSLDAFLLVISTWPAIPSPSTISPGPGDCTAYHGAFGTVAGPINTSTGGYDYSISDISIPTSAGNLAFEREYTSLSIDNPTLFSPGWTHNHDSRLIFPEDPGGEANHILFKAHTANQYIFTINGDGTYSAYPGLCSTLVNDQGYYLVKDSGGNTYTFDSAGVLQSFADAQGHTWNYSYSNGKLELIEANGGSVYLDLEYDIQGRVESVSDHAERSVTYHYDVSTGDLTSVDDVLDQTWTYEYDPNLNLLTRVAAPGDVTVERTEYYPDGRAWKQFDGEDNLIVELIYNPDGTTTIKDSLDDANPETHSYDERGTLRIEENSDGGQQENHYDFNFRPDLITDPLGNPTVMDWSDEGTSLEYIKDALNNETFVSYGDYNNPTSIIDPLSYETKYFYADSNFPTLPTRIEYPLSFDGGVTWIGTDYEYYLPSSGAAAGKVKLVTDALGNQTFYTYDSSGQMETVTTAYGTPDALTTTYDYDDLGRMVSVTDEQGIVTNNEYDAAGRLTKTIRNVHPSITTQNYQDKYNIVTEYRYDLRGNQIAVIDTYGTITRTYFDLANRPVTVVQNLFVNGTEDDINTPIGNIPVYNPDFSDRNVRMDTEYDDAGNVIITRDPAGIITRTYYDEANRPKLVIQNWAGTDLYGDISTAPAYNPAYPDQNVRTEYFYDANGNVIAVRDTLGVYTRTYYDELNRPVTVVQNLTGQDISVETPPDRGSSSNIRTDSYYDANGNVILTVDPKGILTRTYYDALNRPITVVQNLARTVAEAISNPTPPGAGVEFNIRSDTYYDEAGNVIATVDPRGVVARTYYDSTDRPVTIVNNLVNWDIYLDTPPARGDGLSDENVRTDVAYDQYGRRDTTTDPFGRVTKYEYDEVGRLSKVIGNYVNGGVPQNDGNQQNIVTTYTYDALGRQVTTTDTMNRVAWSVYDDLGRVVTITQNYLEGQPQNYEDSGDRFNIVTTYTYDARGNQIGMTDTTGVKMRTYYDSLGRPNIVARNFTGVITDPNPPARANPPDPETNLRMDTVYLGNGSVDYIVDELGKTTDYSYDALGRLTAVLDPLLNPTGYEYDANGSRTLMTDAEGISTRYEYDGLNRLKAVVENYRPGFAPTNEINVRTEYGYDAGGNRLSILDGNNNPASFTYTAFGQIKTEADALGNDYTYGYDSMGNRRSVLDANDALTIFDYDELNRLISIDYPGSDPDVSFEYDVLGRRLSMTDGLGTTSWDFNNLDLPNSIIDPFSTQVSYEYDEVGNRTLLSYGSQSYAYQYNDVNRLEEVISGQSSVISYQYDASGRLKTVARPNGVNTTYSYYDNGWLQDIFHISGTETLASYQYQYDNVGNRVQAIENVALPSVTNEAPQFELGSDAALDEGSQFTRSIPFTDPDSSEWQLTIDYGDGTTPTQTTLYAEGNIELAHVYADNGIHTLTVTLNDNEGGETSDSILVNVANLPPVVNAGEDQAAGVNDTVTVNASYIDAGVYDTHTATIDWGDGNSEPVNVTPTGTGTGTVSAQHAFNSTGNFTAEVCVTDSDSGIGCDSLNVNVGGGFPSTGVLDDFNRADGAIGSNWSGNTSAYGISSNQLDVVDDGSNTDIYWANESFGADQEVFVTFSQVDPNGWEQDLLLKSQSSATWGDGVLEVLYDANNDIVQVWTWKWPQEWVQYGADIPVTFSNGDTFGARALADGTVEVYKNGELLATRDISSWNHYADGGYIGLWFGGADDAILDDFGGGSIPGGESLMSILMEEPNETITPEQLNVEVSNADLFWQGILLDTTEEAKVTFAQLNKTTVRSKPRSNGVWGEGTIQVMYDVLNGRIQLWRYDVEKGWMQTGKDLSAKFAEGDVFTVRIGKNGSIEVYQNGKLLGKRDVTIQSTHFASTHLTGRFYRVNESRSLAVVTPQMADVFFTQYALQTQSYSVTITYDYDDLYRLTEANYSNGDYYHYGYDAVGNRLSQETFISGLHTTTGYLYDDANRLTSVNGVTYDWDDNGNLVNDGVSTYEYDSANRLTSISGGTSATFAYNGLGDRLTQNGVNYTLDLNTGLTQVLDDGTNAYGYGNGRIAQANGTTTEYFLGDALGSVRQLTDASGAITLAKSYDSYGTVSQSVGSGTSIYAYTGEQTDVSGLTYLRARYYAGGDGRFISRDTWRGDINVPMSYNKWGYAYQNPINLVDPTGLKPGDSKYCLPLSGKDWLYCNNIVRGINPEQPMTVGDYIVFDQLDSCYTPPLQDVLPHRINKNTPLANGWWFHYLVDKAPGWWNNNGKDHAYFSDVIGFAIGAEMGTLRDFKFGLLLAHGFANKGWKEGMYNMLGGRQSATGRVNTAIYGSDKGGTYQICGKTNTSKNCTPFNTVASNFTNVLNDINLLLTGGGVTNNVIDLGHMVLWHSSWRNWSVDAPYEWGNPTAYTAANYPLLMAALGGNPRNDSTDIRHVLYHNIALPKDARPDKNGYYNVAFVISQAQQNEMCNTHSCVGP